MALPDYSQNGFYDPSNAYKGVNNFQIPTGSPLYNAYGTDQDPKAVYNTKLTQMGLGGFGGRARTAQSLYGRVTEGYGQARLNKNFELFFPEYLDQVNLGRVMGGMSHEAQGLDDNRYSSRYRWGMRS